MDNPFQRAPDDSPSPQPDELPGPPPSRGPALRDLMTLRLILACTVIGMAGILLWQSWRTSREQQAAGGQAEVLEMLGGGRQPLPPDDPLLALAYTTYSFGPGNVYRISLPSTGGGVIPLLDSDWPLDPSVALVWHGYSTASVQDIVVRIAPQVSADPSVYQNWLNSTIDALRSERSNEPEGDLTQFHAGGRNWHNLPLSREDTVAGRREALDVNMAQFGHDAVSVTFYFALPPGEGVIERLIPAVLESVESELEKDSESEREAGV